MTNITHQYLVEYEIDPVLEKLKQERWYLIPPDGGDPVLHREIGPAVTTYDLVRGGEPTREYYEHGDRMMVIPPNRPEQIPT